MRFFRLIQLFFQRNFVFRINFLMQWFTVVLKFSFTVLFWLSAMGTSNSFSYSKMQMMIYFFVVMLIGFFVETDITEKVSTAIYQGNLSVDLLKPISYSFLNFTSYFAMKLCIVVFLVICAIALRFFPAYSAAFAISVFFSLIINFEMSYLIGILAFWTNTVWGISMVNSVLLDVFGGRLFPIEIAPSGMQKLCTFLPYQYIFYVPLQILERRATPLLMVGQIACAVVLFLFSRLIWQQGLKHYEATGM